MRVHIDLQPPFIEFIFRCAPAPLYFFHVFELFFSRARFDFAFILLLSLYFLHIMIIPLYYSVFWVLVGFYGWENPNYLRFKENHTWEYGTTYYASSDVVYFRPRIYTPTFYCFLVVVFSWAFWFSLVYVFSV